MGVASLASTTFDREPSIFGRWLILLCLTLLGAGCASKQVVVEGTFPAPLLDPLPVTIGLIYPSAFAEHEFFDEAKGRAESDWLVKTGEAQVAFWDIFLPACLTKWYSFRTGKQCKPAAPISMAY